MRNVLWQADAWKEYLDLQTDKEKLKKVNRLISDIQRNGYLCSYGKAEMLKGNFRGMRACESQKKTA